MRHTVIGQKDLLTRIRRFKREADALERLVIADADIAQGGFVRRVMRLRRITDRLIEEALVAHLHHRLCSKPPGDWQQEIDNVTACLRTHLK